MKVQGKVDKLGALSRQYADFSAKKYKKIQNINKSAKEPPCGKPTPEALLGTYILLPVFVIFVSKNTLTKPRYSLPLPE